MFSRREPPIVISVGGSLIIPNGGIDTEFLSNLNRFIRKYVARGRRFFLITGGGTVMRYYRDGAASVIKNVTSEDLDWLGIHVTRVNAHLLRTIFQDIAHPRIIENYNKRLIRWKEPVVIGAGWRPGSSTDYCATILARDYGAYVVINLSNIDWIYDKDPKKYPDAKRIEKITWEEMEKLIPRKWVPGMNTPFDPIATQLGKKNHLTVVVTNGKDFDNLEKIIDGDVFKGTIIVPYRIDEGFYDRAYYTGRKGEHRVAHESLFGKLFHSLINKYRAFIIKFFINPKTVLDVGCGTGGLVQALRNFDIDAYGVEVSEYALGSIGKNLKQYIKKGDITRLPYKDNKFDLVLTYDVMEHIERSKLKQAIKESVRVSKKYIFHKIYTRENIWITWFHRRDFSHVSFFTKNYWTYIFSSFKEVNILKKTIFILPSFFETIFVLKKK